MEQQITEWLREDAQASRECILAMRQWAARVYSRVKIKRVLGDAVVIVTQSGGGETVLVPFNSIYDVKRLEPQG